MRSRPSPKAQHPKSPLDSELLSKRILAELHCKSAAFPEPSRVPDLHSQLTALHEQNSKLTEEVKFLKKKQGDAAQQQATYSNVIAKLQKELARPQPGASTASAGNLQQIKSHLGELEQSIFGLQERASAVILRREDDIIRSYDMKYNQLLREEKEKLGQAANQNKHREIKTLHRQVESLASKIVCYEQMNESLVRENRENKRKLANLHSENLLLTERVRKAAPLKLHYFKSPKSSAAFSPKSQAKTAPRQEQAKTRAARTAYFRELELNNTLRASLKSCIAHIEQGLTPTASPESLRALLFAHRDLLQGAFHTAFPSRIDFSRILHSIDS